MRKIEYCGAWLAFGGHTLSKGRQISVSIPFYEFLADSFDACLLCELSQKSSIEQGGGDFFKIRG